MRHSVVLVGLFALACPEYHLEGPADPLDKPGDTEPPDDSEPHRETGAPRDSGAPGDSDPAAVEECNGEDDDGDGLVDEGFPDSDGDGLADCIDDACDVDEHPGGSVGVVSECAAVDPTSVADPWNVVVEWQWATASSWGVIHKLAVGNLTDDNGDGVVDEDDVPDIAFTTWMDDELVALHGDGSGVIFQVAGFEGTADVAIADVDGDGFNEIVAVTVGSRVAAVDACGTLKWTSRYQSGILEPPLTVADVDADGSPEVIFDKGVLSGLTGGTLFELPDPEMSYYTALAADIDTDGTQEIILGGTVCSHVGVPEWSAEYVGSAASQFAAVANLDGDSGGEIIFAAEDRLYLHEPDGTLIRSIELPDTFAGPPAVADFDGDGQVEIAVPSTSAISVWESTGAMLWSRSIEDTTGAAGCSAFDMNGDGAFEVLYADEVTFTIFDGTTGTARYTNTGHDSRTGLEYPVIADLDGDASAEIAIASSYGTWGGITVLGHASDRWADAGPAWGIHSYSVTNLGDDGSVPSAPPLPWLDHNMFRARPALPRPGSPDLTVALEDWCVASCESGPVLVSFAVANQGGVDVEAGTLASLWGKPGGVETLIDTVALGPIPSGQVIPGGTFELLPMQWGDGLVLRVDDDGSGVGGITECDETNNIARFEEPICD
jgi:hypothetical protein